MIETVHTIGIEAPLHKHDARLLAESMYMKGDPSKLCADQRSTAPNLCTSTQKHVPGDLRPLRFDSTTTLSAVAALSVLTLQH